MPAHGQRRPGSTLEAFPVSFAFFNFKI